MWVLDPPSGYPGKTRFLGRPWAKVPRWDPEKVFLSIRQRFVARDRGQAQGCHPIGVVGVHVGTRQGRWVSWENSFFRETVGTRVGGGVFLLRMSKGMTPV